MTEEIRESLSALLDGEMDGQEADGLLGRIRDDEELRRLWGRYHMVGDLMRGEKLLLDASILADRIQVQLRDEPAIIAAPRRPPSAETGQPSTKTVASTPIPISGSASRQPHSWRRFAAGAALAASVAALAVFVAPILSPEQASVPQQLAVVGEPARAPITEVDAEGNRWKKLPSDVAARLNGYLVQHSDYAASDGMGSVLPYTNFVSYDRNR